AEIADAPWLAAELVHPGGEEERDAQAEGMRTLAGELDERLRPELRLVRLTGDPRHEREITLRHDRRIVPVAQRVPAVTLDVVHPQHVVEMRPRAIGSAVPEADLAEEAARLHDQRLVTGLPATFEESLRETGGPPEPALLDRDAREAVERRQQLGRVAHLLAQRLRARVRARGRRCGVSPGGDEHRPEASPQHPLPAIPRPPRPHRP